MQPPQGESHARRKRVRAPYEAESACSRAVHPARRAEDPARLEAVPARPRVGDLDGLLAALDRQVVPLLPFAPRAGIELAVAAGEVEAVEHDGRRDARAAVGHELAGR